ncbi:MAG: hypothetical protein QCH35_05170 [Methanomicrobiaceae archaeon]|nr:hypothetical protein [Methanomicrobiaceae archaeon]
MWVVVRKLDGKVSEVELPTSHYVEIGDVLSDGSVVIDLPYTDEPEEDFMPMDTYDEEELD